MATALETMKNWRTAFNNHDREDIEAAYADDVVFEAPAGVHVRGRDETVDYAMDWLDAFPDATMHIESEITDGEWVAQRFVFEGTHSNDLTGPAGRIPATNRRLHGRGAQVSRVQGSKITEAYLYYDQLDVLSQLGVDSELLASR